MLISLGGAGSQKGKIVLPDGSLEGCTTCIASDSHSKLMRHIGAFFLNNLVWVGHCHNDHPLVIWQTSSHGCKGVRVEDLDGQNILVNLKISFSNKRFIHPKKGHSRRQCVRLGFIQLNNIGSFHCLRKNFVMGCTPRDSGFGPAHQQNMEREWERVQAM